MKARALLIAALILAVVGTFFVAMSLYGITQIRSDVKPKVSAPVARDLHICPYCNSPYPGEIKNGKFVFDDHPMVDMPLTATKHWRTCVKCYFSIIQAMVQVHAGELIEDPPDVSVVNPRHHPVSI